MVTDIENEMAALVAVSINRAFGVELSDYQVVVGFAMLDQLADRRRRRARRTIRTLRKTLKTDEERAFAAAAAVFRYALPGHTVDVLTLDKAHAGLVSGLYGTIAQRLGVEDECLKVSVFDEVRGGETAVVLGPDVRGLPGFQRVACLPR